MNTLHFLLQVLQQHHIACMHKHNFHTLQLFNEPHIFFSYTAGRFMARAFHTATGAARSQGHSTKFSCFFWKQIC